MNRRDLFKSLAMVALGVPIMKEILKEPDYSGPVTLEEATLFPRGNSGYIFITTGGVGGGGGSGTQHPLAPSENRWEQCYVDNIRFLENK